MEHFERWLVAKPTKPDRPLVTLSYAQGADGSIAAQRGQPNAISGSESLKITHRIRTTHDAIIIGVGTILSDDPQLTVRLVEGGDPRVVVLDSQLRTPTTAKIMHGEPLIFCVANANTEAQAQLEGADAQVERQMGRDGRVDLGQMLRRLHELGIGRVMVEGGGEVIASFLEAELVDRVAITTAPGFTGGYKPRMSALDALPAKNTQTVQLGADTLTWGDL